MVKALTAEMTVETEIVTANWRKNWPVIPLMNAQGTNTAQSTRAMAMIGPLISSMAWMWPSRASSPLAICRSMFSSDDDRVVDHDPDRQHQPEQRDVVEAEAHRRHHGEGADQRDRHVDHRQDHGPPVLEEHQHDDGDQTTTAPKSV